MPGQFFADDYGQKVVLIKWDMGMKYIDIEFAGARLVRLEGPDLLIATGMEGAAPDGSHLSVRASRSSGPVTYDVARNGQPLHAMPIDYAMHPPVVELVDAMNSNGRAGSSQGGLSMDNKGRLVKDGLVVDDSVLQYAAGARKIDHGAITGGRVWVVIHTVLTVLVGFFRIAAFVLAGMAISQSKEPESAATQDVSFLVTAFIWGAIFATVVVMGLWLYATVRAFRQVPSFGLAKGLLLFTYLPTIYACYALAKLNLFAAIFTAILPCVILYFGMRALGRAQDAASSIVFNKDREQHLTAHGQRL